MFLYPFIHTFEFVVTHFNYSLRPMNFSLAPFSASNSLWFESYNLLKIGTFMPFSVRSSGIIRHFGRQRPSPQHQYQQSHGKSQHPNLATPVASHIYVTKRWKNSIVYLAPKFGNSVGRRWLRTMVSRRVFRLSFFVEQTKMKKR